jgi:hypothetical protein
MRTRNLVGYFLALCMGVGVISASAGQSASERPGRPEHSRPAAQRSVSRQEGSNTADVRAGTKINAELESALDAQTAKPGDKVEARVTKNVKQHGRVVVHKGDRLLGSVVQAGSSAQGKGKAGSQMSVAFDRLVTAQGESQLNAVLTSVVSTPSERRARQSRESEPSPMMAPVAAPSGGGAGGGLIGGATGGVGATAGGALGGVGSAAGAAGSAAGNVGGAVGAASRTSLGSSSNLGLSTPLRQIHVNSSAQAQNQTGLNSVLSARHGDLRLESGTEMQFRVAGGASARGASGKRH